MTIYPRFCLISHLSEQRIKKENCEESGLVISRQCGHELNHVLSLCFMDF